MYKTVYRDNLGEDHILDFDSDYQAINVIRNRAISELKCEGRLTIIKLWVYQDDKQIYYEDLQTTLRR